MDTGVLISPSGQRSVIATGFADLVDLNISADQINSSNSRHNGLLSVAKRYFVEAIYDTPDSIESNGVAFKDVSLFTATPDDLPYVGAVRPGLFFNICHSNRKLVNSCWSAELISDMLVSGIDDCVSVGCSNENDKIGDIDVSLLSPLRFR